MCQVHDNSYTVVVVAFVALEVAREAAPPVLAHSAAAAAELVAESTHVAAVEVPAVGRGMTYEVQ